jgi:molybdenum cofactor synthesis domain-containing protein
MVEDPRLKGLRKYEYIDEALKKFLSHINIRIKESETVLVDEALGRVVAEDIISPINVPPFNRAAMDGYAVIAGDTFGASSDNPISLKIVGESSPGAPYTGKIKSGEAVKISTGAKMPEGANAVVMVEYTKEFNGYVEIYKSVAEFQNVSKAGEDLKKGEIAISAGTVLEPFDLALLHYIGKNAVRVRKKPIVAIGATGSELVPVEEFEKAFKSEKKIIETNRIMFMNIVKKAGGLPLDLGIIGDDPEKIKSALEKGLNEADIVVLSGGSSVGKYDYIPQIINKMGKPGVIIHGVTAHPGRPLALASINGKPVINVPGYPVAAYIDFVLFVPPLIYKFLGIKGRYMPRTVKAVLDSKIPSKPGTRTFARVKIFEKNGELHAVPIRITGSGVLSSLSRAQGIVVVPEDLEGYNMGEKVDVILLRRFV